MKKRRRYPTKAKPPFAIHVPEGTNLENSVPDHAIARGNPVFWITLAIASIMGAFPIFAIACKLLP